MAAGAPDAAQLGKLVAHVPQLVDRVLGDLVVVALECPGEQLKGRRDVSAPPSPRRSSDDPTVAELPSL